MTGTVILDNEAVQALWSAKHPKHRRALGYVQVIAVRKRKGRRAARVLVPTAVRVEAGWDRSAPEAAFINLLGIVDAPLDGVAANRAAAIARQHQVSVTDAHVGATLQLLPDGSGPVTIVSSDAKDMSTVAGNTPVTALGL